MCGLFASYDLTTFKRLAITNSYRGSFVWSVMSLTKDYNVRYLHTITMPFEPGILDNLKLQEGDFFIGHIQAPTTEHGVNTHPAVDGHHMLWHNGIIKSRQIPELQQLVGSNERWDTALMAKMYSQNKMNLSMLDGTFACFHLKLGEYLKVFRNEISPLFTDDYMSTFSSVKTGYTTKPVEPNTVFDIRLRSKQCVPTYEFTTKENPYYWEE